MARVNVVREFLGEVVYAVKDPDDYYWSTPKRSWVSNIKNATFYKNKESAEYCLMQNGYTNNRYDKLDLQLVTLRIKAVEIDTSSPCLFVRTTPAVPAYETRYFGFPEKGDRIVNTTESEITADTD